MAQCPISNPPTAAEWQYSKSFHGHLGPWLSLGMRVGLEAMERTAARSYFGVTVHVVCPLSPPHSCLIDGLQLSTGATSGKQNMVAAESESIEVFVTNRDTEESVTVRVLASTGGLFSHWYRDLGEEEAARKVWDVPLDTLCEFVAIGEAGNAG